MNWFIHLEFCDSYIDQGKNPQLYTKDCMEKSLVKNEAVKGKIDAFKVSINLSKDSRSYDDVDHMYTEGAFGQLGNFLQRNQFIHTVQK